MNLKNFFYAFAGMFIADIFIKLFGNVTFSIFRDFFALGLISYSVFYIVRDTCNRMEIQDSDRDEAEAFIRKCGDYLDKNPVHFASPLSTEKYSEPEFSEHEQIHFISGTVCGENLEAFVDSLPVQIFIENERTYAAFNRVSLSLLGGISFEKIPG